jgi:hypothetical protein
MALDESTHQFVSQLLEVQPTNLLSADSKVKDALRAGTFNLRLLRLWSASGILQGGVGRVESPGQLLNGYWLVFSNLSWQTYNFTDRLTRYGFRLSSHEPVDHHIGVPIWPIARPEAVGYAQIAAVGVSSVPVRYSAVPDKLRVQLDPIPTSGDGSLAYRPCDVILNDGRQIERVYVMPEEPYIWIWGVWPEDDKEKNTLRIDDIATVKESRHRLPVRFANKLYAAGESGMGFTIFTVVFDDGSRLSIGAGGAIDFIDYPPSKGPVNVVDVLPHVGRDSPDLRTGPQYYWCLYSC